MRLSLDPNTLSLFIVHCLFEKSSALMNVGRMLNVAEDTEKLKMFTFHFLLK